MTRRMPLLVESLATIPSDDVPLRLGYRPVAAETSSWYCSWTLIAHARPMYIEDWFQMHCACENNRIGLTGVRVPGSGRNEPSRAE